MVNDPNQQKHPGDTAQGTNDQTYGAAVSRMAEPIHPAQQSAPPKKTWWQKPKRIEHIIQTLTLLFVGAYTAITFCLFISTREANRVQFEKLRNPLLKLNGRPTPPKVKSPSPKTRKYGNCAPMSWWTRKASFRLRKTFQSGSLICLIT
jgi:hypothetical protein